ncbi:MAG: sulfur globule family protein [Thiohalocapsa sp.]
MCGRLDDYLRTSASTGWPVGEENRVSSRQTASGSANGGGRGYGRGYDRFQGYNGYLGYGYATDGYAPYYRPGHPVAMTGPQVSAAPQTSMARQAPVAQQVSVGDTKRPREPVLAGSFNDSYRSGASANEKSTGIAMPGDASSGR